LTSNGIFKECATTTRPCRVGPSGPCSQVACNAPVTHLPICHPLLRERPLTVRPTGSTHIVLCRRFRRRCCLLGVVVVLVAAVEAAERLKQRPLFATLDLLGLFRRPTTSYLQLIRRRMSSTVAGDIVTDKLPARQSVCLSDCCLCVCVCVCGLFASCSLRPLSPPLPPIVPKRDAADHPLRVMHSVPLVASGVNPPGIIWAPVCSERSAVAAPVVDRRSLGCCCCCCCYRCWRCCWPRSPQLTHAACVRLRADRSPSSQNDRWLVHRTVSARETALCHADDYHGTARSVHIV